VAPSESAVRPKTGDSETTQKSKPKGNGGVRQTNCTLTKTGDERRVKIWDYFIATKGDRPKHILEKDEGSRRKYESDLQGLNGSDVKRQALFPPRGAHKKGGAIQKKRGKRGRKPLLRLKSTNNN